MCCPLLFLKILNSLSSVEGLRVVFNLGFANVSELLGIMLKINFKENSYLQVFHEYDYFREEEGEDALCSS